MAPTRSAQPLEALAQAVEGINAATTALQSGGGDRQITGSLHITGLREALLEAGDHEDMVSGKRFSQYRNQQSHY